VIYYRARIHLSLQWKSKLQLLDLNPI